MTIKDLNDIIRQRRSIFPPAYRPDQLIEEPLIREILENAHHAPTHRLTQPWSFKILRGPALQRLADFMVEDYQVNTPLEEQSEVKMNKMASNPLRSACVIAICMKPNLDLLPEWEEVAAVAMAVQNMWLTCTAHGIGAYWSTPAAIVERGAGFFDLKDGERCLGLFYMGYTDAQPQPARRVPLDEKLTWLDA